MAFESLSEKLGGVFKRLKNRGKLSESDVKEVMREVRMALLEADVNYKVAKDFVKSVSERANGAEVLQSLTPAQQVIKIVHEEMITLMGTQAERLHFQSLPPTVLMMCGLQGSGKTTHCGKLAKYFKDQGKRVRLCACDVYRPAAVQQLLVVGEKAGVPVYEEGQGNPIEIAKAALRQAKDYGDDLLIIDTAGRLHIDEGLMQELQDMKAAVNPHEILLVVDAMTGQDAVNVAKSFDEQLDLTGVILTKLDGDTRGGAALSVRAVTGKPIKFSGIGEKIGDLEVFHPDRMASRILGMGDVLTFIEKAQNAVDEEKAKQLEQKLRANKFDMNDLMDQIQQMRKMGSVSQMAAMMGANQLSDEDAEAGEKHLRRMEAMIQSMTPAEREKPSLINPSRKRRIAAGSGTRVEDVNRLLRQTENMQKLIKKYSSKSMRKKLARMGGGMNMPGMM